ncbi:hypothetical protein [Aquirufa rosea]|uniref:Uncharacterized protein n=1 Tax=Aquirufa rosea TaxID=2509241 RepID=A0A4Q1BZ98_9BACT|nr:hypothetical protein [Aquirufa rosea]RXK48831.1 hypothetical protein ESB04_07700 [Aquirufa rosea]
MKNVYAFLFVSLLCLSFQVSAQYKSINLTAATDTTYLGDNGSKSRTTRLLSFEYDTSMDAAFAQVSMDVHHINPFDLPEIIVNGKSVPANIYFPSMATNTKFYFFKVKGLTDLVVNSPVGNNNAKLSFILSAKDILPGKNIVRITIGNRAIENLDDFAITNPKVELRSKASSDSYSDYSK